MTETAILLEKEKFWKDWFQEPASGLAILPDYATSRKEASRRAVCGFNLPGEPGREQHEILTNLLSYAGMLLHLYSGKQEITIGIPASPAPSVETILAPVKLTVEPGLSFRSLSARARSALDLALAHADLQLNNWLSAANGIGLFELSITLEEFLGQVNQHSHPLHLSFKPDIHGCSAQLFYDPAWFEEETIERLARQLVSLAKEMIDDDTRQLKHLTLLTAAEKETILYNWSKPGPQLALNAPTIDRVFEEQVSRRPDQIALVTGEEVFSYAEIDMMATQLAVQLCARGVSKGTRVALFLPRTAEMILAILAICKCGAAYLPLSLHFPIERIRKLLDDSEALFVLVSDNSGTIDIESPACLSVNTILSEQAPKTCFHRTHTAEDLIYLIYTSGSTGAPKGVAVEHRNVVNLVWGLNERIYSLHDDQLRVAMLAPYEFDASVQQIFGTLLLGHSLHLVDDSARTNGMELAAYYRRHQIDISDGTPSHLRLLLNGVPAEEFPLSVRHFIIAGEILAKETVQQVLERSVASKPHITNLYGPTEACVDCTSYRICEKQLSHLRSIPIGIPLPGQSVYIINEQLELQPPGIVGEIYIGGKGLARGYWKNDALTGERFILWHTGERLYKTGDLARWRNDGTIEFHGRIDDQVKIRGYRIELVEIEQAIAQQGQTAAQAVICRTSDTGDKTLEAYLVPHSDRASFISRLLSVKDTPAYSDLNLAELPDGFTLFCSAQGESEKEYDLLKQTCFEDIELPPDIKCIVQLGVDHGVLAIATSAIFPAAQFHFCDGPFAKWKELQANLDAYQVSDRVEFITDGLSGMAENLRAQRGGLDLLIVTGSGSGERLKEWFLHSSLPAQHILVFVHGDQEKRSARELLSANGYSIQTRNGGQGFVFAGSLEFKIETGISPGISRMLQTIASNCEGPARAEAGLRDHLSRHLPPYMIPALIHWVKELPLNNSGKVDKKKLSALKGIHPGKKMAPEIKNEVIIQLIEVWAGVLDRPQLSIDENFFSIGGDSIKAIQIAARMSKKGYRMQLKDVFDHQTIRDLAPHIEDSKPSMVEESAVTGEVPLTPIQHGFFEWHRHEVHHYNQSVLLEPKMQVDLDMLNAVFQRLVVHHDALRIHFQQDNNMWKQFNRDIQKRFTVQHLDLSGIAPDSSEWMQTMDGLQKSLDISGGWLLKVVLIHTLAGQRLLIIVHHLVIDGVSWRVLLEDLHTLCDQHQQGRPLCLPPKSHSFKTWSLALQQYARSEAMTKEKSYWEKIERARVQPMERENHTAGNKISDSSRYTIQLDRGQTELLLTRANIPFYTEINDLLLAALGVAFRKTFRTEQLLFNLEGHGREKITDNLDMNRTIGWFTSVYPVLLQLECAELWEQFIPEVKETLRRIPNKGSSYGILRYLLPHSLPAQASRPAILFNYLGQFTGAVPEENWKVAEEYQGQTRSPMHERTHDFDFTAMVTGGEFLLTLSYNKNHFPETNTALLMNNIQFSLQDLIEYCCHREDKHLTPSDVTMKGLSLEEISGIFS